MGYGIFVRKGVIKAKFKRNFEIQCFSIETSNDDLKNKTAMKRFEPFN
jgi:hypothetical protein